MNVTVLGRICPSSRGVTPASDSHSRRFHPLYQQGDTNRAIYSDAILSMVGLLVAGFNCCLLSVGESKSGKSYTLAGEGTSELGIIQMAIKDLFNQLSQTDSFSVKIRMYDLYNEIIADLLNGRSVCELAVNAQQGFHVQNLTEVLVKDKSNAVDVFNTGWSARNSERTDFGETSSWTTVVTELLLSQDRDVLGYPYISTFTFVDLPGAEKLAADPTTVLRNEGPLLNKSILTLARVVEKLAKTPHPASVVDYDESKLTSLMRDALGGNCNTKVIVHQRSRSEPEVTQAVMDLADDFGKVVNYCVMNDTAARGMIGQHRAQILHLQAQREQNAGPSPVSRGFDSNELADRNAQLLKENMKLHEEDGYLRRKLDQLEVRLVDVTMAKTDMSTRLIINEEEKLKISKALVDLQIENNRIKEKASQESFELNNKLMTVDSDCRQAILSKQRYAKDSTLYKDRLDLLEKERQSLVDKFVRLRADHKTLADKYDSEVGRNQALGLELLTLLNAKVTLLKQGENLARAANHRKEETAVELRRARDIALGLSTQKQKAIEIRSTQLDRHELQAKLFANRDRMRSEFDTMRNQYDDQQELLQERIMELNAVLKKSRQATRDGQHKLAQQEVELLSSREKAREMTVANSRLQMSLMSNSEEMRTRLHKYLEDIAEFVNDRDAALHRKMEDNLSNYVHGMMKDLKETYKAREKQLSDAARDFKEKMKMVAKQHEQLLVAYRYLRMQVEQSEMKEVDLGPEEDKLTLSDEALDSANRKEIRRLTELLQKGQANQGGGAGIPIGDGESELQRQIGQFTSTSQQELEAERASLLSSTAILEEQLAECHDYIDKHLHKLNEENASLKRMMGLQEQDGNRSDDPPPRLRRGKYPRNNGPALTQPNWRHY